MVRDASNSSESGRPELLESPQADEQFAEAVQVAQQEKRGKVRVRVLTQLYRYGKGQRYKNWRGVLWRLDLDPTLVAAGNFRASLQAFFDAVSTIGPARVVEVLQEAVHGSK